MVAVASALLIVPQEGEVKNTQGLHVVYKDIVGIPTACWGQTGKDLKGNPLIKGKTYTQSECEEWFSKDVSSYHASMKSYVKVELKPHEEIAFTSFVWNVGLGAWKSSTALKKVNEGDLPGACSQLLRWNKATFTSNASRKTQEARGEVCTALQGGRWSCTVKGLTNRREAEYKVCMGNDANVQQAITQLNREGWKSVAVDVGE